MVKPRANGVQLKIGKLWGQTKALEIRSPLPFNRRNAASASQAGAAIDFSMNFVAFPI